MSYNIEAAARDLKEALAGQPKEIAGGGNPIGRAQANLSRLLTGIDGGHDISADAMCVCGRWYRHHFVRLDDEDSRMWCQKDGAEYFTATGATRRPDSEHTALIRLTREDAIELAAHRLALMVDDIPGCGGTDTQPIEEWLGDDDAVRMWKVRQIQDDLTRVKQLLGPFEHGPIIEPTEESDSAPD